MERKRIQICAGVLAILLLMLSACTGEPPDLKTKQPAMGRYIEQMVPFPAEFTLVLGLHKAADGSLNLLGYPKNTDGNGTIYLHSYRSIDAGANWTEETPAWLDFFNAEDSSYGCEYAFWAPDGTLWFYLNWYRNEESGNSYARLEDGQITILDWSPPNSSDGIGPQGFQIAEHGDLILNCVTEFLQVDPSSGSVKNVYTSAAMDGGILNDGWAVTGTTLALSESRRIVCYDLTTGKETTSFPTHGPTSNSDSAGDNFRVMDYGLDGKLYFADPKGIYRCVAGNDTLEQLADGSLLSLSTPSLRRQCLLALRNQFLLLTWSNGVWQLLSYRYDPDTPTLPDTELSVWSLTEDPLIPQAISALQTSDPSIHVTYTVGIFEENSVTRDDAIGRINTLLLAGKGPDVLVLDGLPYHSYVEKEVLSDLSEEIEALASADKLLPHIATSYKNTDGTAYAIPAQFQVPMLHGTDEAMNAIQDLNTMADWLEGAKGSFRTPFFFSSPESYLRFFYPAYATNLTGMDGRIDEGALRNFLTQIKRIADLRTDVEDYGDVEDSYDFKFGALGLSVGYNALDAGNLLQFKGLYAAWTTDDKNGGGRIDTLFGANSYLPVTALGINAQSKQPSLAWKFIETVLSNDVQGQAVGKGMPVCSSAFDDAAQEHDSNNGGQYSTYGTTLRDAEGAETSVTIQVMYPPDTFRQQMADRLKGLDTPLFYDETLLELMISSTSNFWKGNASLDETVSAILRTLTLYESE